jgi:hypothetical protein
MFSLLSPVGAISPVEQLLECSLYNNNSGSVASNAEGHRNLADSLLLRLYFSNDIMPADWVELWIWTLLFNRVL